MQLRFAVVALVACSGGDPMPAPNAPVGSAEPVPVPVGDAKPATTPGLPTPGVRLPDGATPLSYDLRLEIDPDHDAFTGTVAIHIKLDREGDHVWLHADQLELHTATWDEGALEVIHVPGADRMIAVSFGKRLQPRELTLTFAFTGNTQHDEEGLFRQKEGEHWYLYSQGESEFARRITPCFDEPRWKTPWRVTLVVAKNQVAAGNMAAVHEQVLADGRKEISFAPTPAMPSYLLAIAVGPFAVIDAGSVGANHVPVRVLTFPERAKSVGAVARQTGKLVKELEDYTQIPLPFPKLDIVTVPHLFGAMENPGLITFDADIVFEGDRRYVAIAAHELAHQWFGNLVTPVWWDDLWLSEAFASWLGERLAAHNEGHPPGELHVAFTRESALEADGEAGARALHRPVTFDPDNAFDSIAYDKGEAVLSMFEQWIGEDRFRDGLRAYLGAHAGGNVTTADLVAAITPPEAGTALQGYVDHAGAPIVELALDCAGTPSLTATARDHLHIPVCVRLGGTRACVLATLATPIPLPDGCPKSVIASGGGYYHVVWTTNPPRGASPAWRTLALGDKIALGADLAAATERGDLAPTGAFAEITELAASKDPYGVHAAASIAGAIDAVVEDGQRDRWESWLAERFAPSLRLGMARTPIDARVRGELLALISAPHLPADVRARAKAFVTSALAKKIAPFDTPTLLAASADHAAFLAIAKLAHDPKIDGDVREIAMQDLSTFGPAEVGNAVGELLTLLPDRAAWTAVGAYFERGATRSTAWAAIRDHATELFARMSPSQAGDMLDATASLCDAHARAEVAATFTPQTGKILDGKPRLEHVLASIDRCLARRARAGVLPL